MKSERRFPPPWSVEDIGAAFVVKDGGGQKDPPPRKAAGEQSWETIDIFNGTPDRFWLDAYFVSGTTALHISAARDTRQKVAWPPSNLRLTISPLAPHRQRHPNRVSAPDRASAGMEGPFRVNLHEGGLFNPVSFREIEIKCLIVASRHRGHPRNTQAILSSETETDEGWRIFTLSLIPASDQPPSNYSRKTRRSGSRRTLHGACLSKEFVTPRRDRNLFWRRIARPPSLFSLD
jgi:hypothetical protein